MSQAIATARAAPSRGEVVRAMVACTKPGITRLVTITALVGFAVAGVGHAWSGLELVLTALACTIGTAMSAAGANALNMWMERGRDACMTRTMQRPLPAGVLSPRAVFALGVSLVIVGLSVLLLIGPAPTLVSLACVVTYLVLYTPLKVVTIWSTIVGAIPGALPPLIGWAAASEQGGLAPLADIRGWSLFALMFVWQIPHFLAIAWMYRDDYADGGYRVLPVIDPVGTWTTVSIVFFTLVLIPVTLIPALLMPDRLGIVYLPIAMLSGIGFVCLVAHLAVERTTKRARAVFFGSIIHLPVLFFAMAGEALVRVLL